MKYPSSLSLLVGAAVGWSLSGAIIKVADMSALAIAFYRSAIAALFLAPLAWRRRMPLHADQMGIALAYISTVVLLVVATKATTAANAIILQYTAPAYVFFLAIPLLGERPCGRDWGGLLATMVGVGCIFSQAGAGDVAGVLYGLGSGLSFALLTVLLRKHRDIDPIWSICLNNACVGLLLLPWVWDELWLERRELVLMALMGVVQLGVPYVLFARALRHVEARDAALISLLEPVLNPVWVYLVMGEIPASMTLVGGLIIGLGLVWRFATTGSNPVVK